MGNLKLAICGHGESGKDTVCEILRDKCEMVFTGGTSWHALDIVWDEWGHIFYEHKNQCYDDRRNHREKWAEIIWAYNGDDPCRLYRKIVQDSDILQGIRDDKEMLAVKRARLVDYWIWIARDSAPKDPTMKFGPDDCNLTIYNNGSIGDLVKAVNETYMFLSV